MNWLDFIFAGLLLLVAYAGWCLRGLFLVAAAFSITLGPWLALKLQPLLGPRLDPMVHPVVPGDTLAFWLVLVLATAAVLLLFHALAGTLEALRLSWLDRGAGALASLGLAFCLGAFLFLDVVAHNPGPRTGELMQQSWFCKTAFPQAPHLGKPFESFMEGVFESGQTGKDTKAKTVPKTSRPSHSKKTHATAG